MPSARDIVLLHAGGDGDPEVRAAGRHDADAVVEIGSVTKTFTAALLHVLAADRTVSLDDPVTAYLDIEGDLAMTLRQLADHTSGLPRLPPGIRRLGSDPYARIDDEAFAGTIRELPRHVVAEPGQREEYSNFGYGVLGAALASACDSSWFDAIDTRVLKPLDLDEPVVLEHDVPTGRRLVALDRRGRPRKPWALGPLAPAGGLWTTPRTLGEYTRKVLVDRAFGAIPVGWQSLGEVTWHNGATRDAAVFVGAKGQRWSVCHGLRQAPTRIDGIGLAVLDLPATSAS